MFSLLFSTFYFSTFYFKLILKVTYRQPQFVMFLKKIKG